MAVRTFGGNQKNLPNYTGLQVQTSALGIPIMIGWGKNRCTFNLIWWNDFKKHEQSAKGKGGGKATQYSYSVSLLLALGWGIISSIPKVYLNQSIVTLAQLNLTLKTGTSSQTPFAYIVTAHPDQALSYPNIAYLASSSFQLGNSPILPSMAFEAVMNLSGSIAPGIPDANMADIIPDFLTNPLYGMGLEAGNIGTSIDHYSDYLLANDMLYSPMLTTQEKATQVLNRWAELTNSWIFWSGREIKFVPLGTESATAHSTTYTPITTIRYNLGIGDFLDADQPVQIKRKDPADAHNTLRIEITDRAHDYNKNPIEYKNQTLIDLFGVRDTSITAGEITRADVGLKVATLLGKRKAYLVNEYSFRTDHRYIALEPGDLVTLTDPTNEAITLLPVRIKTVDNDEDGNLSFTAEDYDGVIGNFDSHTIQDGTVISFDKFVDPGDVNPPMIFEPRSDVASPAQLWIAASGGANWGGCDVWASTDDITYGKIGTIPSPAAQGVLTATLPNVADPDTTSTLQIDLTQSDIQINPSVTHADADDGRTLSYIVAQPIAGVIQTGGELIAYGEVTPTGTFTDDLEYLRRGRHGTSPASHASGQQFTAVDLSGVSGSLFKFELPTAYIGQTLYFKFLSFNLYDLNTQQIADVDPYQYTTSGTGYGGGTGGVPTTPTGLTAGIGTSSNFLSWNSNPPTDNVQVYKLYRATGTGQSFGSASLIWTGNANAYTDASITSGQGYTYFLKATNVVGDSAATAGVNATSSVFTRPLRVCAGTPNRKPQAEEILFTIPMKNGDVLPANLSGSLLKIDVDGGGVAPTSNWTIDLRKNASVVYTGTILAGATSGTFSSGAQITFVDGDFLTGRCITPQDATCEGISLTLVGTRTQ